MAVAAKNTRQQTHKQTGDLEFELELKWFLYHTGLY
jgi:hypothetical protein